MRRVSVVRSVVTAFVLAGTSGVARADEKDLVLDLGATTLELRQVPRGTFMMGSPAAETTHEKDEEPAHQVTIARELWVGKTPVTRGQFAKFVADTHYVTEAEKGQTGGAGWDGKELKQKKEYTWKNPGFTQAEDHPVVMVTFGDATAFASWASRKTGKRVRLPTEAEWEYAARAGTTGLWYSGSADADAASIGWFKTNAGWTTHPVGQKKANAWGLFDMSGNTFEWCRDHYGAYKDASAIDPEQTTAGEGAEKRVLRGGSWMRDVKRARSAARKGAAPGTRNAENGFRVVVIGEDAIAPAVGGGPGPDFLPVAPLGANGAPASSASAAPAGSAAGPLPDGGEPLRGELATSGSDSFSWSLLFLSPLAAAAAVVAWMMLRPKRGVAVARAPSRAPAAAPPARQPAPSRVGPPTPAVPSPPVAPPIIPRPTSTARMPATPSVIVEDVPLELPAAAVAAAASPSQTQKLAPVAAPPSQTQKLAPVVAPSETNKLPVAEPETQKLPDAPSEPLPAAEAAPASPAAAPFEGPPSPPAPLAKPKPSEPEPEEIEPEEITSGPPPLPAAAPSSKAPPPPPSSKSIPPVPPSSKSIPPAAASSRSVPPPVPSSRPLPPAPPSSSKVLEEEKKPEEVEEKKPPAEEEKKPEPPKEEPKAEEPKAEEPKAVEEEKKEEEKKEEEKKEEEPKPEPPKGEPTAVEEEKKEEEKKEEEKKEEEPKPEPPKEEPKAVEEEKKEEEPKPEPPKEEPKAVEEEKEEPKAEEETKPEAPKEEPKAEEEKKPDDEKKTEEEKTPEDEKA